MIVLRNRTHLLLEVSDMLVVFFVSYWNLDVLQLIDELFCDILTSDLKLKACVRESITFKNRYCITKTFSRLTDETSYLAGRVHTQGSRVHNGQTLDLEMIVENLSHLLSVLLWIEWRIGHENVHIFGFEIKFIENVAPH
jgi:hypothetical protein